MSASFAERTGLSVPIPLLTFEPLMNEGGVLPRLMALASLARQLDPSLPNSLRAYRHVPEGDTPTEIPFSLVFTNDTRSVLPNGVVEDSGVQRFWDVMDRVLPDSMAAAERRTLDMRVHERRQPSIDAAIEDGYRSGLVSLELHPHAAQENDKIYTNALPVADDAFMAYSDLATRAFITGTNKPNTSTAVGRLIARFQAVCETLSKPFESATTVERQKLGENIRMLDASQGSRGETFEENHRHGWAAFALANGGKGWTSSLLCDVGVSPYAPYGQFSPISLAVGSNDRAGTVALLDANVSPNTVLRGWPKMFAGREPAVFTHDPVDFLPLAVFGAAVGSTAAVGALLERGADANFATEKKDTALHMACKHGYEATARLLDVHGADFTKKNRHGHAPDEVIPAAKLYDSMHAWATVRLNQMNSVLANQPTVTPARTLGERVRQTSLASEAEAQEVLWAAPPQPVKALRNRTNS